jgi:hypothetical protein
MAFSSCLDPNGELPHSAVSERLGAAACLIDRQLVRVGGDVVEICQNATYTWGWVRGDLGEEVPGAVHQAALPQRLREHHLDRADKPGCAVGITSSDAQRPRVTGSPRKPAHVVALVDAGCQPQHRAPLSGDGPGPRPTQLDASENASRPGTGAPARSRQDRASSALVGSSWANDRVQRSQGRPGSWRATVAILRLVSAVSSSVGDQAGGRHPIGWRQGFAAMAN